VSHECEAKGGEPSAQRKKHACKDTRVCFLMSRPVIQRDADGRWTNMCWPVRGPAATQSACLPACCLHLHLSRTPKVLARHNRVARLITHGSQPLATPLTQDFSVPRLRFRSACIVDVSCLMFLLSLSLSLGPKNPLPFHLHS